jgi:hypothetical protein
MHKRLVSFVHYSDHDSMFHDDVVLIRAGSNLFIQYNRAKGYNEDTDMPDTVTITEAESIDAVSNRVAALYAGESYAFNNFDFQNNTLIIEVCSLVQFAAEYTLDYGIVSIYLDDGVQKSSCNSVYTPQPTATPDPPTIAPTAFPTAFTEPNLPTAAPVIVDTWTRTPNHSTRSPSIPMTSDHMHGEDSYGGPLKNPHTGGAIVDTDIAADESDMSGTGRDKTDKMGLVVLASFLAALAISAAAVAVCLGVKTCRRGMHVEKRSRRRKKRVIETRKVIHASETRQEEDDTSRSSNDTADGEVYGITEAKSGNHITERSMEVRNQP